MNDALKKAHEARAAKKAAGIAVVQLSPIEKAQKDPTSKAKAIVAKCCDCVGGPDEAHWKKAITYCPCDDCPLFPVRPYQNKKQEAAIEEED